MITNQALFLEFCPLTIYQRDKIRKYIEFPTYVLWMEIFDIKLYNMTIAEYIAIAHEPFKEIYTIYKDTGKWLNKPSRFILKEVLKHLFYFITNYDYHICSDIEQKIFLSPKNPFVSFPN